MIRSKTGITELAILGNAPEFSRELFVNKPNLVNRDSFKRDLDAILDSRWFTNNGPMVQKLEKQIARFLNVRNCVLTCNGTMALSLVSEIMGLEGEVIMPSFTFVSTAHALTWKGIKPVFCDIESKSWNINPERIEELLTEHTTGIIATHLWGNSCDTDSLQQIADQYGLRLIYDAAHAFACSHKGRMIGSFGDAEIFSFHSTKFFHTFEGGAITTNNDELASNARSVRNFGFKGYDKVDSLGLNAKMPEVCAAMGIANLRNVDQTIQGNRDTWNRYSQGLTWVSGIRLKGFNEYEHSNYQYVVAIVSEEEFGLSRDDLVEVLHAENIIARKYFFPGIHMMEPYKTKYPEAGALLPVTNAISQKVMLLPGGNGISLSQIDRITSLIGIASENAEAIKSVFRSSRSNITVNKLSEQTKKPAEMIEKDLPKVEFRIPISANEGNLRLAHYFLESLQEFGGPIARAAHCVFSVGQDDPQPELLENCEWASDHSVEFQMLDKELFDKWEYDGTGFHRLLIKSNADIVIQADADILITGDFDDVIMKSCRSNLLMGFLAHVSPFIDESFSSVSSREWWEKIYREAGLPKPQLNFEHTGFGLMSDDKNHQMCPHYYNYGFIVSPREIADVLGESFEHELENIDRILETWFKSQIALTVMFSRHGIPCENLPINYNFPLHVDGDKMRELNPDPQGLNSPEDVKIFHYLGNGEFNRTHFETRESLDKVLNRKKTSNYGAVFLRKLRAVHQRITDRYR